MKHSTITPKILLIACLIVIFNRAFGCRSSWSRYADNCYKIFDYTGTRDEASENCKTQVSDLVSISDTSILDFLVQRVAHDNLFLDDETKFWVGLTRKDGELMWLDGTRANQSWIKSPEPDASEVSSGSECFAFNGQVVTKEDCDDDNHAYICGYHISDHRISRSCYQGPETVMISFLGDGSGNCIYRAPNLTSKDKVEDLCSVTPNAHFVDFDALMRDGLSSFYRYKVLCNDGSKYWTNLSWDGSNLLFSNGTIVSDDHLISVVEGPGSCITVQFNFTDTLLLTFYQTNCNESAYVVCSYGNSNQPSSTTISRRSLQELTFSSDGENCPEGYNWKADRMKNYCYWETSFETDQLSWDDAENYCRGYGGHLASFHSVDEEKIGLSFQYGSLAHDYWIGLTFDPNTETYKWTDNSSLDYTNWAPGHPNHKDKQLRCVSMHAQDKHWTSSLCGILSWFICKVPKRSIHPDYVIPTPTPLESCEVIPSFTAKSSYYFQGACYFAVGESKSWHRAKQYCEDQGASLVSIHSTEEIGFLLRLLHGAMESNRVWIGLNSFGSDGNFRWTDWTAVDFTFFAPNEPNNYQNQEKCVNMNTRDGQWIDENCNAAFGFICKRLNDTSVSTIIPTTQDPRIGNCKKGWIAHYDRCYYIGGKREKDRLNWTEALDFCQKNGGYLTSIRDSKEQNFLSYLLQTLGDDAWIGLHDTIQSGKYYWLDNSELQYTNWSPGEPSFFGIMEDCVKMVFNHMNSGVWQDDVCLRKIGFICQSNKDPQLPPPPSERGMNCIHPEGWLKLDTMCFKMFAGDHLTWVEAENACQKEGGHLVSVSDQKIKAVVTYLATEVNRPFSIGLKYDENSHTVSWLNNFPVRLTNWEKNEPSRLTDDTCFASTSEGYWKKSACDEKMPYLCQITTGKHKKLNKFVGECSPSSELWLPGSQSYCYILNSVLQWDWYTANLMCFRFGSNLISLHSMEEVEDIKKLVKPGIRSIYLGLMRNSKGGFTWTDDSPVNFENWEEGEPANSEDQCVEMMTDNMKWKVTPCLSKKHFVCMDTKGTLVKEDPESSKYTSENAGGLSTAVICGVVFSILVVVIIVVAAVLYRRKTYRMPQFRRQDRDSNISFENALYEVGSSRMVFSDENKS